MGEITISTNEVLDYLSNPNYMEQLQSQSLEVRRQIAELDVQHSGIVAEIQKKDGLARCAGCYKKNDRRTPEGVLLEIPDDTSSN